MKRILSLTILLAVATIADGAKTIAVTKNLTVKIGAINQAVLNTDGAKLAIYGAPEGDAEKVLLTHHRRDVISAARSAIARKAKVVAPDAERALIADVEAFWDNFKTARFHDYEQQSTKILGKSIDVATWVKEGDKIEWQGITFKVLDTPGYTRGAVSYIAEIDGKKIAFTGDLIYGNGQLFDLYSFQDAIPEANVRGYHGFGSRLAKLVPSLRKIAAEKPDILVPARGPVIHKPEKSIAKLVDRVQKLYLNYQSTNALNWYFKKDRLTTCTKRIVDDVSQLKLMPYSYHEKSPDWVWENGTSRMLIADNGHGFLLDCGNQRYIDAIKKLMEDNLIKKVDGIFVTHYHDDHTDMVQAAAEEFKCPVYATSEYADILARPDAYHMPAMTSNAIKVSAVKSGHKMKWHEFELTMEFFPGQTYYHGALLAKKKDEKPIFFIGDAFSPSGMDDYCVLNRNLVGRGNGYNLCFEKMKAIDGDYWLVNEHIPFVFSYNDKEFAGLQKRFEQRVEMFSELFPFDDPNYGIDEQWAWPNPYVTITKPSQRVVGSFNVTNHSPTTRRFTVNPDGHSLKVTGIGLFEAKPGEVVNRNYSLDAPQKPGTYVITFDVATEGMSFNEWAEAIVIVE